MKKIIFIQLILFATLGAMAQSVDKKYINPASGYSNAVAVTTGTVTTLYVAGQVGSGATLNEQIRTSFQGVLKQLKDGGATFKDVVKMNTYIVNYSEKDLDLFRDIRKDMFGDQEMPANTLVGVSSLATDDIKVEMDAVAIFAKN